MLAALALHCNAQTELEQVQFSGDIRALIPADGGGTVTAPDEAVHDFDPAAGTGNSFVPLGFLDAEDVDGFDLDRYSLDIPATVNGTFMRPADVFTADGTKVLDAEAAGIPANVDVDAISRDPDTGDLVFSIDTSAEFGGALFDPVDLIRWDGSSFSFVRDEMNAGSSNVDALHLFSGDAALFSLSTNTELDGGVAGDEDVLETQLSAAGPPTLVFSPPHESWQEADLDALWADPFLPGALVWAETEAEVFEDAGSVNLTIERVGGTDSSFTVNFDIVEGTATRDEDFVGLGGGVPFDDGETSDTVSIDLLDDGMTEGDETFTVELTGTTGDGTIGSPSVVTVLIRDDEDFLFEDGFEDL